MAWKTFIPMYDGQGNTLSLFDDEQAEQVRYVYTAFGERLDILGNPSLTPFQWNGRWGYYYDEDLGEYHVRARPYGPVDARWLAADPIDVIAEHLYEYCDLAPTMQVDPSGLQCRPTPNGVQHLFRGHFGTIAIGFYDVESDKVLGMFSGPRRLGSTIVGRWYADQPFPTGDAGECCCDAVGVVQVVLSESFQYARWVLDTGHTPRVDRYIPYPHASILRDPCHSGQDHEVVFGDSPNAPAFRAFRKRWYLKSLHQEFETCIVCLQGCEGLRENYVLRPAFPHPTSLDAVVSGITTYDCVRWGHRIDLTTVTPGWPVEGPGTYTYARWIENSHSNPGDSETRSQASWTGPGHPPGREWITTVLGHRLATFHFE